MKTSAYKMIADFYNANKSKFPMDLKTFVNAFEMKNIGFRPFVKDGQPEYYKGKGGILQTFPDGKLIQVLKFVDSTGAIYADISPEVAKMFWSNGGPDGKDWTNGKKFQITVDEWTVGDKSGVNITLRVKPEIFAANICL